MSTYIQFTGAFPIREECYVKAVAIEKFIVLQSPMLPCTELKKIQTFGHCREAVMGVRNYVIAFVGGSTIMSC